MALIDLPEAGRPYVVVRADGERGLLDLSASAIVDLYKEHGALLIRGLPGDLDAFRRFAAQFCSSSVFNESPDRRLLDEEHNIQSVNGGAMAFPLHPELSREPWKPDVCFFHCLTPPREGGATTLCDGVAIAAGMPREIATVLAQRRLVYVQPAASEVLDFWLGTPTPSDAQLASPPAHCPYIFRRLNAPAANGPTPIVRAFSRPALHRPMFTDGPAFGNFLLFARYLLGRRGFPVLDTGQEVPDAWLAAIKAVSDRLTVPIAWQAGDVLMLDNSRFMHGRTAIVDTDERLIASYFGYLSFAPPVPDEPADPPWRQAAFRPPVPRAAA